MGQYRVAIIREHLQGLESVPSTVAITGGPPTRPEDFCVCLILLLILGESAEDATGSWLPECRQSQ